MTNYQVHAERGRKFWLVRVSELGYTTQARHLGEVDEMARDLIATMLEVDPDEFDIEVRVATPDSR